MRCAANHARTRYRPSCAGRSTGALRSGPTLAFASGMAARSGGHGAGPRRRHDHSAGRLLPGATRAPCPQRDAGPPQAYTAQLTAVRPDPLGAATLLAAARSTTAARPLPDT